jgi:8-oxo-dGTP pyrophosphatase MutT (NUDIX family)
LAEAVDDLAELQADAEAAGRRCVVAALIVRDGRAFVHRRGPDRAFLPNCWDVPGGHVEPGETLVEALRRELLEETGWHVVGAPELVHIADWHLQRGDPSTARREFDFLVAIDGDPLRPRLEYPKQVEFRWIAPGEMDVLDENRDRDDGMVRQLVEIAFERAGSRAAG